MNFSKQFLGFEWVSNYSWLLCWSYLAGNQTYFPLPILCGYSGAIHTLASGLPLCLEKRCFKVQPVWSILKLAFKESESHLRSACLSPWSARGTLKDQLKHFYCIYLSLGEGNSTFFPTSKTQSKETVLLPLRLIFFLISEALGSWVFLLFWNPGLQGMLFSKSKERMGVIKEVFKSSTSFLAQPSKITAGFDSYKVDNGSSD